MGVSTSRKSRSAKKFRIIRMAFVRVRKISLDIRVDDEVEVTLAITDLNIRQAMPFLGKGTKRLGQELKRLDLDREFPGLCPEDLSFDPDDVPDIELLEELEGFVADDIFPDIGLNPSLSVLDLDETGLPKISDRHDPAGDRTGFPPKMPIASSERESKA